MTIRTYSSPEAFKQALEQRLRTSAKSGAEFARKRQLLVFDRFLARVFAVLGDAATLKGGLVLELRLERARTTKDVDLRMVGSPDDILARLQEAARRDLADFMTFEVGPDEDHPEIQNDGMQYDGLRFRTECRLAGKLYGQPFGVDVAFGDPILGEPEVVVAEDVLAFAGIAPPTEKLHAYTMPRSRPNSRVKDLPDIALLATAQPIDAKRVRSESIPHSRRVAGRESTIEPIQRMSRENRLWGAERFRGELLRLGMWRRRSMGARAPTGPKPVRAACRARRLAARRTLPGAVALSLSGPEFATARVALNLAPSSARSAESERGPRLTLASTARWFGVG